MTGLRRPIDGFALGTMVLLCTIWGVQQVAIKVAAPDVAPILQVALRSGISASLVVLLVRLRGERLALGGPTLRPGVLAGALFAAEFLFVAEGLRHTTASHMSVFLYTSPAFTALGLAFRLPAERLRPRQWLGVAIAFGGIAVALAGGSPPAGAGPRALLGDALGILAGAAWGATTVVIRCSTLSEAPPARTLVYQLLGGFVLLSGYAALTGQAGRFHPTPLAWASLLFQGVVVSFASYLAWFWLLRRYLASRLSIFSFLTPLFGVAFGVLLLREPLTVPFALGAVMGLAGVLIASGAEAFRRPDPRRPAR